MSKRQARKEVFLVLSSFVVGSLMMLLFMTVLIYTKSENKETPMGRTPVILQKNTIVGSLGKIQDATVAIQGFKEGNQETTASGFIYKTDDNYGYILTNEHILRGQDAAKVYLPTDEVVDATILGKDKYLDLAVLRIEKKYVHLVATMGSSEQSKVGETIYTIGAPMGLEYQGSVTSGIISGKDRMVNLAEEETGSWQMKAMQIDAPINPGSSGGPLCNLNGDVIGITTMKLIDTRIEGMGFAIPIEYAMSHIKSLENKEEIKWPVLGIEIVNISDTTSLVRNEIPIPTIKKGVVISNVKEDSAAASKLKKGDIIIRIDGKDVNSIAELKYAIYQHQSGDKMVVNYIRDDNEKSTVITLK